MNFQTTTATTSLMAYGASTKAIIKRRQGIQPANNIATASASRNSPNTTALTTIAVLSVAVQK